MTNLPKFNPVAAPDAVVIAPQVRFTVLTSRLLRLEYSPTDTFEDRPSQVFWYRHQPVPKFEVVRSAEQIELNTADLQVCYHIQANGFTADALSITLKASGQVWHYGDTDPANLGGTLRTLDAVDGTLPLPNGLMSRSGWAIIDDAKSLVFNQDGWLENRGGQANQDLYFFGYGQNYLQCLRDYTKLTGDVPLLPRWALGNWWSRYWAYTQQELTDLMSSFREYEVPLAVCIVDMDWHITKTGNRSSGWTGYTWNKELFPDHVGFINWLHQQGLKTSLNLHPADGIHPHEAAYEAMARAMDIDPTTQEPVPFDIADPKFTQAYFEILHHPMEQEGIDFWWMDWQQGTMSKLPALDPLWWLNHLHFYDLARHGNKRPFVFSRWGGWGNHRYPIGFSGDTYITWASLAFQPYFTATAANVGYGWWSHDIGGHWGGLNEAEIFVRWIQYGLFSPILRLHSTSNPYLDRYPWSYDETTLALIRQAMQLRHAFIPYLYTMSWRNQQESIPLITPMYYHHPQEEAAYVCPNQYYFGCELLAAPYTRPRDPDTALSRQVVWLPSGEWFDFVSGQYYQGDSWHALYGTLTETPLFAKAGAMVPLAPQVGWGGVKNPTTLTLHLFPGADNCFTLYEDDGESLPTESGGYALTTFRQTWQANRWQFKIEPVRGDIAQVPPSRNYELCFKAIVKPDEVQVAINQVVSPIAWYYDQAKQLFRLSMTLAPTDDLTVTVAVKDGTLLFSQDNTWATCDKLLRAFRLEVGVKADLGRQFGDIINDINLLANYVVNLKPAHLIALAEVMTGAGCEHIRNIGRDELLILWNNQRRPELKFKLTTHRQGTEHSELPKFKVIRPISKHKWQLQLHYGDWLEDKKE